MNKKDILDIFKSVYIAHRGLFDNNGDAPENTLGAFQRAVEAGYGIELDVQLCKDNKLVIAHDNSLKRNCNVDKYIRDLTYEEICQYKVFKSNEKVPLLEEVLQIICGKVPVIVEIKAEKEYKTICSLTYDMLENYKGVYCIESFAPKIVHWFSRKHPEVVRGQLADDFVFLNYYKSKFKNWARTNMIYNYINKPDFIAYNHQYRTNRCISYWKKKLKCAVAGWTLQSQSDIDNSNEMFDIIIFDGFLPRQKLNTNLNCK